VAAERTHELRTRCGRSTGHEGKQHGADGLPDGGPAVVGGTVLLCALQPDLAYLHPMTQPQHAPPAPPRAPPRAHADLTAPVLGKRARRPSTKAWGPAAIHDHNLLSGVPCCLTVDGPGCGIAECGNRVLRSDQTELRELLGIGCGAFALEDLSDGQWVGEYGGKLTVSRARPSISPLKQYTLSGSVGSTGWVTVDADGVPATKRVLCHWINHACGDSANCEICWVEDDKDIHRPFCKSRILCFVLCRQQYS